MPSRKVSHYEILDRLGAGGMGEIYRARDSRLNRMVAIKALPKDDSTDAHRRRRFLQEAQAASALNHPNIVTVHDILIDDGADLLVMELVSGQTLADRISPAGLGCRDVLHFGAQIAAALAAAHAAGIVHRDIKPRNIMVTAAGTIKVLDFGLAKTNFTGFAGESDETVPSLTLRGTVMGTVAYMSPEQAEGKEVDARSDIFSLGVLLYEMITGQSPFTGDSALSTLTAILRDDVQPIQELAPQTPEPLVAIVDRCLRKDRGERFQSMEEVRAALEDLREQHVSRTAPTEIAAPPSRTRWARIPMALSALCVAGLVGGTWWWITRQKPAAPAPAPAVEKTAPAPVVAESALTNDSIVEMVRAKVRPAIIMEHIRSSKAQFDLSTGELIRLTQAGVPEVVIQVMRNPKAQVPPAQPSKRPDPVVQPAAPAWRTIPVDDGLSFPIELGADIPRDAPSGALLRFRVSSDVRAAGTVVIAKGAAVSGEIVEENRRTALIIPRKMTYQLLQADAVNGQKLKLRATAGRTSGQSRGAVQAGDQKMPKGLAALAGTRYTAYIDGAQTLALRLP